MGPVSYNGLGKISPLVQWCHLDVMGVVCHFLIDLNAYCTRWNPSWYSHQYQEAVVREALRPRERTYHCYHRIKLSPKNLLLHLWVSDLSLHRRSF